MDENYLQRLLLIWELMYKTEPWCQGRRLPCSPEYVVENWGEWDHVHAQQ